MSTMVISKKKDFEPHPQTDALVRAVIVDVTPPEWKETKFGQRQKFSIVFETEMKRPDGNPWTVWEAGLTPSLDEKARLTKHLKRLFPNGIPDPFDLESLVGLPCRIMVEHRKEEGGDKIFASPSMITKETDMANALKPSGTFKRKKDRDSEGGEGGKSYSKIPGEADAPPWHETKVHVGRFAGTAVADLPGIEAVDALLSHWWPTVSKPKADDKRLHAALLEAKKVLESASQQAEPANF